jgi:uncharacterized protein
MQIDAGTTPPDAPATVELRRLDPRVRTFWLISGALSSIPWLVMALLVDLVLPVPLPVPDGVLAAGVTGTLLGLVLLTVPIRYRRWAFAVRDRELWIRRGLLQVSTTVIPFRRLQFVDTTQGPLERLLGLAEVIVHTASPGTAGRLIGLSLADAEELRDHLAALTAGDDVI